MATVYFAASLFSAGHG
jgi:hypothetical protein